MRIRKYLPIGVIAIRTARLRSKSKTPTSAVGWCLREVRECFRVNARDGSASEGWRDAKYKHAYNPAKHGTVADFIKTIPRGVPVWWTGGDGHVAIATGWRGRCFSTDILRSGYFDRVDIAYINSKWSHLRFMGWTEDINGVKVHPDKAA